MKATSGTGSLEVGFVHVQLSELKKTNAGQKKKMFSWHFLSSLHVQWGKGFFQYRNIKIWMSNCSHSPHPGHELECQWFLQLLYSCNQHVALSAAAYLEKTSNLTQEKTASCSHRSTEIFIPASHFLWFYVNKSPFLLSASPESHTKCHIRIT